MLLLYKLNKTGTSKFNILLIALLLLLVFDASAETTFFDQDDAFIMGNSTAAEAPVPKSGTTAGTSGSGSPHAALIPSLPTDSVESSLVSANVPEIIYLPNQEETGIAEFLVVSNKNIKNARFIINLLPKKPWFMPDAGKKVYKYLKMDARNIDADDLTESIKITFKVRKLWLEENSLGISQVDLKRFDGGWKPLKTFITGSDKDYAYYYALSPGFSYFAIAEGTATEIMDSLKQEAPPVEERPFKNGKQTGRLFGASVLIVAFLGMIALYLYIRHCKCVNASKRKKQKVLSEMKAVFRRNK